MTEVEVGANPPRVLLVVAPYYRRVTTLLEEGACRRLAAANARVSRIEVPGALEIPSAIRIRHETDPVDGYVALGCVIRGETTHYDTVATESARGLMNLGVWRGICIGNGILTVDSLSQALVRADPVRKDKGGDAAAACLSLLQLRVAP